MSLYFITTLDPVELAQRAKQKTTCYAGRTSKVRLKKSPHWRYNVVVQAT